MNIEELPQYQNMLEDVRRDKYIVGCLMAGSHAKELAQRDSDLDVYLLLRDDTARVAIKKIKQRLNTRYGSIKIDLHNKALQTLKEFSHYAQTGSAYAWDRYNVARSKIVVDKARGQLKKLLKKKQVLGKREQQVLMERFLGEYITHTYRSMRSLAQEKKSEATLDAIEAVPCFLEVLFALQGRVRPYNKYLQWELDTFLLKESVWPIDHFLESLERMSQADPHILRESYLFIEKLARQKGYGKFFDAWGKNSKLDLIKYYGTHESV